MARSDDSSDDTSNDGGSQPVTRPVDVARDAVEPPAVDPADIDSPAVDPPTVDSADVDPGELLALIAAQREATRRRTEPSLAVIASFWGGAWLIGYLVLWFSYDDGVRHSPAWAFITFGLLLVAAVGLTALHIGRRFGGVHGESATVGAMYGWTWVVGFLTASLIFAGVARVGTDPDVMTVLTNSVSCLVVGLIYIAGGMLWREWQMFFLGIWIAVVGGAAALVPPPGTYLVMALAGGGGFLVVAGAAVLRSRRTA